MTTIYTLGYAAWSITDVQEGAEDLGALVVDVRKKAYSSKPGFSARGLRRELGERYVHIEELGNANYQGGPIETEDFEAGRQKLGQAFRERRPDTLVLMCGCKDPEACHRSVVAEKLAEKEGLGITHLAPPQDQQGLFA